MSEEPTELEEIETLEIDNAEHILRWDHRDDGYERIKRSLCGTIYFTPDPEQEISVCEECLSAAERAKTA